MPQDAEIIGQVSYGSGEIIYTYYHKYNPDKHWHLWKVADWTHSTPEPVSVRDIYFWITPPQEYLDNLSPNHLDEIQNKITRARATYPKG